MVTAVPDEGKGERLVVLHLELNGLDVHQIWQQLLGKGLPNLWVPCERDFYLISELPLLGSGKVDLKRVKEMALEQAEGEMTLAACRVVLVRPPSPLTSVPPRVSCATWVTATWCWSRGKPTRRIRAVCLATHAEDILQQARIVAELGEAVADCLLVLGTSARTGGLFAGNRWDRPEEILPRLLPVLEQGPCALVFGPEPSGLTNAEVVTLISHPYSHRAGRPALNLAQAVAICLYELRQVWLRQTQPLPPQQQPAPFAAQEQMFARLQTALEEVHFLYGDKAAGLMHALRHLIGRAQPSAMEVDVLMGLARQLRWYVANRQQ